MNIDFEKYKYLRVGSVSPYIKVGNPEYNSTKIIELIHEAEKENMQVLTFPELCLTGLNDVLYSTPFGVSL